MPSLQVRKRDIAVLWLLDSGLAQMPVLPFLMRSLMFQNFKLFICEMAVVKAASHANYEDNICNPPGVVQMGGRPPPEDTAPEGIPGTQAASKIPPRSATGRK